MASPAFPVLQGYCPAVKHQNAKETVSNSATKEKQGKPVQAAPVILPKGGNALEARELAQSSATQSHRPDNRRDSIRNRRDPPAL